MRWRAAVVAAVLIATTAFGGAAQAQDAPVTPPADTTVDDFLHALVFDFSYFIRQRPGGLMYVQYPDEAEDQTHPDTGQQADLFGGQLDVLGAATAVAPRVPDEKLTERLDGFGDLSEWLDTGPGDPVEQADEPSPDDGPLEVVATPEEGLGGEPTFYAMVELNEGFLDSEADRCGLYVYTRLDDRDLFLEQMGGEANPIRSSNVQYSTVLNADGPGSLSRYAVEPESGLPSPDVTTGTTMAVGNFVLLTVPVAEISDAEWITIAGWCRPIDDVDQYGNPNYDLQTLDVVVDVPVGPGFFDPVIVLIEDPDLAEPEPEPEPEPGFEHDPEPGPEPEVEVEVGAVDGSDTDESESSLAAAGEAALPGVSTESSGSSGGNSSSILLIIVGAVAVGVGAYGFRRLGEPA